MLRTQFLLLQTLIFWEYRKTSISISSSLWRILVSSWSVFYQLFWVFSPVPGSFSHRILSAISSSQCFKELFSSFSSLRCFPIASNIRLISLVSFQEAIRHMDFGLNSSISNKPTFQSKIHHQFMQIQQRFILDKLTISGVILANRTSLLITFLTCT